jgi:putative ABC transport system permease protein
MTLKRTLVTVLLHAYPRGWRAEYGGELADILLMRPLSVAIVVDILRSGVQHRFERLSRDIYHAFRSLTATPAFTLVALAVLTLSIGASTAIFSVVDGVVLRPLPFPHADRLVSVGERNINDPSGFDSYQTTPQNFLDWREQQRVFTQLAAVGYAGMILRPEPRQDPEVLAAQAVTSEFFSVLGVMPLIGRTFAAEHEVEGRARFAVISYLLWQRRFHGSPDIVGQRLPGQLGDFEILGVMPPGFAYPVGAPRATEVWIPRPFTKQDRIRANEFGYNLQVIGRLRDGVSLEQAQAQMDQITAALAAATPRWFTDRVATVEPLQRALTRNVRTWMLMLLAAVGFVLLIACVNLANLMLVRASARSRELAIRSALGAARSDLARALLAESLLLSLGGAALGVFVAWIGVDALVAAIPEDVPRIANIAVDVRVLATMLVVAVTSAMIFSLAPILQFSRPSVGTNVALLVARAHSANVRQQRLRGALVTIEVALAVMLLVGSGLFLASFARVTSVNLGIDPQDVLMVRVRPLVAPANLVIVGAQSAGDAQARNRRLLQNVLDQVRGIPGVEVAAIVSRGVPLRGDLVTEDFGIPGRVLPRGQDLDLNEITPDYFRLLKVPLLAGRLFDDNDRETSEPVVILNDAAAKRFFPNENPIGQTVQFIGTRRIVGIVGNIRHDGPESDWRRQGFVPLSQSRAVGATLALKLSRDPSAVLPAVKTAIWSQFPNVALPEIRTLSDYLNGLIAQRRFNMLLIGLFGLLGIVIACVGVYGVMAYIVTQRTHEIGIRLALGAVPAAILRAVLGRATLYLSAGLMIGLAGAWLLSALIGNFLFQVQPHDPRVYVSVALTLVAAGVLAALLPARRAARVDPLAALRAE